jgi:hypothetical protein
VKHWNLLYQPEVDNKLKEGQNNVAEIVSIELIEGKKVD